MHTLDRILISPSKARKRARQIIYFVSHLPEHANYRRVLRAARRSGVVGADLLIDLKYLGVYLAEFMSTETRRGILSFHYAFLTRKFGDAELGRLWTDGVVIWHRCDETVGQEFSITVEQSALSPMEGESQLRFLMGATMLCTLTFSFLDGASIGLPAAEVLFIGGVQGGANCRREIRIAAKANGEIAPASMLLVATTAIAERFGAGTIAGVSTEDQAAMGHAGDKISLSYDAMWLEAGATRTGNGFFQVVPGSEKPLHMICSRRRSRTRRKRQLKLQVKNAILQRMDELFGPGTTISPATAAAAHPGLSRAEPAERPTIGSAERGYGEATG